MIMFTNNDLQMLQHFPPITPSLMERRWNKSNHVEIAPNCPRCASPNTKFCYYNNYSLSQPRYFCKGCRRYWTKGGSLRNVPVGGGCRKYRRSRSKQGSTNCVRKPSSPDTDSCLLAPNDTGAVEESASIDLAAVYANYLNQNSDSQNKFVADQDVSSGTSTTCLSYDLPVQSSEIDISEYEKSLDLLKEAQLHDQDLCIDEDFVIPNALELQSMLDENLSEEMSWIDDSVNLSNFTWQPAVQLQEFGSFPHEDQLKISANLINHNWNNGFIGI